MVAEGSGVHRRGMDSYLAESTQAPWRRAASLGMLVVLLLAAVGLTFQYRHDHRDEWVHATAPWRGFDVSTDGRTLTFHGWGSGACTEVTGVSFSTDPTEGGQVAATMETRTQVMRDGRALFCNAALSLDGPIERVRLDRPVPDGTIVVDGDTTGAPEAHPCAGTATQVVRAPTTLGIFPGCAAVG